MAGQGTGPLSPARRRVLRALADAGRPLTLSELSEQTGSHPNTLREHLTPLVAAGWVEQVAALGDPGRRGRPPLSYRANGVPPDAGASLLNALLAEVNASLDADALALRAGERWGDGFGAGTRADLVTHLADLGFAPRAVEDGIVLRACPVGAAVSAAPGLVCRMHLGAIRRLLPGEPRVELIPDGHPEGCLVRLDPESRPA